MPDPTAVSDWIRELSTALKGAQFYPMDHPRTAAVIERLGSSTGRLLKPGERLSLGVAQGRLMVDGEFLEDTGHVRSMATHLHQAGILTMTVAGGIGASELRELLSALASPIETIREAGGLVPLLARDAVTLGHVELVPLDYRSLLEGDDDGEKTSEEEMWQDLFSAFAAPGQGGLPGGLVPMMEHAMLHPDSLAKSLERYAVEGGRVSGGRMLSVMKGMVRYFRQNDPDEGELTGSSLAGIIGSLSPEAQARILEAADREEFPLPELINSFISDRERGALISAVAADSREPGARLVSLFLRLGGEDGEALAEAVSKGLAAQGIPMETLSELSATMERLLADAKRDFVGRNYGQTLQQLMIRGHAATRRFIAPAITVLLPDLDGPIIRRELLSIEISLYDRAETPQAREELLRSIAGAAVEHLRAGDIVSLASVTSFLAEICRKHGGGQEAQTVRQAIPETVVEETLGVVRTLDKPQQEAYLPILADLAVLHHEGLLVTLDREQDRGLRRLIVQVLVAAGSDVVPDVAAKLKDPHWFVVRNMITVLREIAPPNLFRLLEGIRNHPDPRVRKEIIKTAGTVKGPHGVALLLQFIGDGSAEIRESAVYYAGLSRAPELIPPLSAIVRRRKIFRPETGLAKAALLALGQFGRPEAVEVLTWAAGRRGLFHREHWRVVRETARAAMGGEQAQEIDNG